MFVISGRQYCFKITNSKDEFLDSVEFYVYTYSENNGDTLNIQLKYFYRKWRHLANTMSLFLRPTETKRTATESRIMILIVLLSLICCRIFLQTVFLHF